MCRFFEKLFWTVGSVVKVSESKAWVESWYYYILLCSQYDFGKVTQLPFVYPSRELDTLYSYLIGWCEDPMKHLYEPQDLAQDKYFRIVHCCSYHYYSNFPYTINFTSWTVILLLIYLGPLVYSGIWIWLPTPSIYYLTFLVGHKSASTQLGSLFQSHKADTKISARLALYSRHSKEQSSFEFI